jgi:hypothetical protein
LSGVENPIRTIKVENEMKRGTEHQPFEDEQGLPVAYVTLH